MKILHILHRSLPGTHGYAMRSKYIVECQRQLSFDPVVITSPFQRGSNGAEINPEYINDIPYYRTNLFGKIGSKEVRSSSILLSAMRFPLIILFAKKVLNVAREIKPAIIHAHSPFYCGLVASWVSRRINVPCVYEIRGVWEGSAVFEKGRTLPLPQRLFRFLEKIAMEKADKLVVISEHLKEEFLFSGIKKEIAVVPNGVDTRKFAAQGKSEKLLDGLDLRGKIVLGYIGTFSAEYEGLECLIRAMPQIVGECPQSVLLLVGDGRLKPGLESLAETLGVGRHVLFTGRIPHEEISEYYSIIDICVYPRVRTVETELVTALKPLEAMACGKAVIGSNVGGIQEIVSDGTTGLLFEAHNKEDCVNKCLRLIEDSRERQLLGEQAKEWVVKNRDWVGVIRLYRYLYDDLLH